MSCSSGQLGVLSNESFILQEIVWKIPNLLSLPRTVDRFVQSPSFRFANAMWRLEIYLNGQTFFGSQGYVDVMIKRIGFVDLQHTVFWEIYFVTRRQQFWSVSGTENFSDIHNVGGPTKYLSQYEINAIAPNATVTVICRMRTQKFPEYETHSQTGLPETCGSSKETDKLKNKNSDFSAASTQTEVDQGIKETDKLKDKNSGCSEASTQTEVDQGNDSVTQLRTPVHVKNLLQDFEELFSSEEDSDVTILVKGRKFQAHKAILKARSSVFAAMLRHNMQEKATGVVDIVDCDPDSFSDLLYYLYCGSLDKLSENNVFSLYVTADKYDVQDLKSECLAFMKKHLSVETFCDTITLSLEYCESELLQLATDFFIRNMAKVIVTVKWQTFMIANPVQCNELLMKAVVRTE